MEVVVLCIHQSISPGHLYVPHQTLFYLKSQMHTSKATISPPDKYMYFVNEVNRFSEINHFPLSVFQVSPYIREFNLIYIIQDGILHFNFHQTALVPTSPQFFRIMVRLADPG